MPLDATNTIPTTEQFFKEFERQQSTYEAQYCFRSLKITRDTWFDDKFYTVSLSYCLVQCANTILTKNETKPVPNQHQSRHLIWYWLIDERLLWYLHLVLDRKNRFTHTNTSLDLNSMPNLYYPYVYRLDLSVYCRATSCGIHSWPVWQFQY